MHQLWNETSIHGWPLLIGGCVRRVVMARPGYRSRGRHRVLVPVTVGKASHRRCGGQKENRSSCRWPEGSPSSVRDDLTVAARPGSPQRYTSRCAVSGTR